MQSIRFPSESARIAQGLPILGCPTLALFARVGIDDTQSPRPLHLHALDPQKGHRPQARPRLRQRLRRSADFVVEGKLELLNTAGNVVAIDLRDIKSVFFVRDFADSDLLSRKTFTTRPRTEGLWVRLKFKDSDIIEGILPADLTQNPAEGFLVTPPDLRSNTQRIFVPRSALTSVTVLAVIGAARRRRKGMPDARQVTLFEQ